MAYDAERDQLFVVFEKVNDRTCGLVQSVSEDGGRSWENGVPILLPTGRQLDGLHPSVAVGTDGALRVLWDEGGNWFFTRVDRSGMASEPSLVHTTIPSKRVINDSLWTVFHRPAGHALDGDDQAVGLDVRTLPGRIWRANGLEATRKGVQAVFLGIDADDEKLYSLHCPAQSGKMAAGATSESEQDVSRQAVLLYGRGQTFDNANGNLSVEVRLGNRGDKPIRTPIRLEVVKVSSEAGKVSILNSDNGRQGSGAVWCLSGIVTGDRILPGSTTYNTATLLFHIDLERSGPVTANSLLTLKARVMARGDTRPKIPEGQLK
jgi:hypothetical protein